MVKIVIKKKEEQGSNVEDANVTSEEIVQDALGKEEEHNLEEHLDEKDKKIQDLEKNLKDMLDLLQRRQAEYENYRKRIERENVEYCKHASDKVICELLDVLDNFSLAIKFGVDQKGVQMIHDQLLSKLENFGVKPVCALGKPFDPNCCEAVDVKKDDSKDDNVVLEELSKGYLSHDKLIRCAKVVVNKKN
ncbi:MAG: nucleotide exchange factor GrpE [Candidatus Woesearchaeota archaeon]|jgi:molecular chaperone GrpE